MRPPSGVAAKIRIIAEPAGAGWLPGDLAFQRPVRRALAAIGMRQHQRAAKARGPFGHAFHFREQPFIALPVIEALPPVARGVNPGAPVQCESTSSPESSANAQPPTRPGDRLRLQPRIGQIAVAVFHDLRCRLRLCDQFQPVPHEPSQLAQLARVPRSQRDGALDLHPLSDLRGVRVCEWPLAGSCRSPRSSWRARIHHAIEFAARERAALRRALHFDQTTRAGHHEIRIDLGATVLAIGQVNQQFAVDQADTDRTHGISQRGFLERAIFYQTVDGTSDRHIGAIDRRGAGPAVGPWITSQSIVMVRSPSRSRSTTARRLRPIKRWISWVRPLILPFWDSRSLRLWVARGNMAYSAVIHPVPLPSRNRGTPLLEADGA